MYALLHSYGSYLLYAMLHSCGFILLYAMYVMQHSYAMLHSYVCYATQLWHILYAIHVCNATYLWYALQYIYWFSYHYCVYGQLKITDIDCCGTMITTHCLNFVKSTVVCCFQFRTVKYLTVCDMPYSPSVIVLNNKLYGVHGKDEHTCTVLKCR